MLVTLLGYLSLAWAPVQSVVTGEWEEGQRLLSGRVVAPDGQPVAGATLRLRLCMPHASRSIGETASAADGAFIVRVESFPYADSWRSSSLEVEAAGFAPSLLERVVLPPRVQDLGEIVLYPPVELRGRVTDADDHPIVGAEVHAALGRATAPYGDHARRPPIARTDERGEFACRALPPGLVTLGVSATSFVDRVLEPIVMSAGGTNRADFELEPERQARLLVLSSEGESLSGVRVEFMGDISDRPWRVQAHHAAFWRAAMLADENGWVALHGLDANFAGDVLVTARDHRPVIVQLGRGEREVLLERVTWLDVVACRTAGGAPPALFEVRIRDRTTPDLDCWNCENAHWLTLSRESPGVECVASDHWRIAWNSPACYVDGGQPREVEANSDEGSSASFDLPDTLEAGGHVECRMEFDAPARLSGVVRDPSGAPVSMSLCVQLSLFSSGCWSVTSDANGQFDFERIGAGPTDLLTSELRWEFDDGCAELELDPGEIRHGVTLTVHPSPPITHGRVAGRLTIGGRPPGEPVLLALDEAKTHHLPRFGPWEVAWTDSAGRFEFSDSAGTYHLVPQHRPGRAAGGWRDFAGEFVAHGDGWRWTITIPEQGTAQAVIDLPPESDWDRVAPPEAAASQD